MTSPKWTNYYCLIPNVSNVGFIDVIVKYYGNFSMKLGRPPEYDLAKTTEIAMHLFWSKGYDATTLKDILDATGISKSSFYYSFGNKYKLFERCIELFRERQLGQIMASMHQAPTGRDFISDFLYGIEKEANSGNKRGCFITNTAFEFSNREKFPEISVLISKATISFAEPFRLAIIRGQSEHLIPEDKNPQVLSLFLVSSIAGLRAMIKGNVKRDQIRDVIVVILSALD